MNNQNSILLIDPSFEPNSSTKCNLLIKIGIDSFSYAIVNKEENKVMAVFDEQECEDVSRKLNSAIKNDNYLGLKFNETKIAAYTENQITIPNAFYRKEDIHLHTKFFPQANVEKTCAIVHAEFDFTSVFSFSNKTEEIINQSLGESKKCEQYTALIKLAENSANTSLILDFTAGSVYILYLSARQVIFQQCYQIETIEELNYYVLLITNQLSINLNDTAVYISGIIDEADEKYGCLIKYFNHIHFLHSKNQHLNQQVLDDMPAHYYTTLLTIDQCV